MTGAVTGAVAAGTAGDRGAGPEIAVGSVTGAGEIAGQLDGDGELLWNAVTVAGAAGLDFTLDSGGLSFEAAGGDVLFGDIEARLTETAGSTEGRVSQRWMW